MSLAKSLRSTDSICIVPYGECGSKITITMTEGTDLYEKLSAAWDEAIFSAKTAEKARRAMEELANTRMDLPLCRWSELSTDILAAIDRLNTQVPA